MAITLRAARVNKNLTQAQAAKLLGVSMYTVANWENGKTFPDAVQIKRIQSVYEVHYDDLIFLPDGYTLSVFYEENGNKEED